MNDRETIREPLGQEILATLERFSSVMAVRLARMDLDQRERYLASVSLLVTKLEQIEKPLRLVLRETAAEALPILMQELSG
jgi:hypothetical protein